MKRWVRGMCCWWLGHRWEVRSKVHRHIGNSVMRAEDCAWCGRRKWVVVKSAMYVVRDGR